MTGKIFEPYDEGFDDYVQKLTKKDYDKRFPISLAKFIYWLDFKPRKNFDFTIQSLNIRYYRVPLSLYYLTMNDSKYRNDEMQLRVNKGRDLQTWNSKVETDEQLQNISESFFNADNLSKKKTITTQIAFMNDQHFSNKIADFVYKHPKVAIFPLPFPEFLYWLINDAGDVSLKIVDLYINKDINKSNFDEIIIARNQSHSESVEESDLLNAYRYSRKDMFEAREVDIRIQNSFNREYKKTSIDQINKYIEMGQSKDYKVNITQVSNL